MSIFNAFTLLGGLAMFLYGMDVMGKGLEKQAGSKLHSILETLTSSPLKGFFLGMIVTAVIQSSSATTVMVVGFVNSGFMTLRQAIGVIMGANVGTTITAWVLSLSGIQGDSFFMTLMKPSTFSPILAFIGIVLYMAAKKDSKKNIGTILLGFAILMTGMDLMSGAVKPLANVPEFTQLFTLFTNPVLGLVVGALLTAVIQSSSASVGILQALSVTGAVTYGSALPIIMGQNIGTCVTALLSCFGANKNARRTAVVHFYFNVIGSVGFMIAFYALNAVIGFSFISDSINAAGIAVIHTLFNVTATAILLPLNRVLEKLAYMTIKDDEGEKEKFQILDERLILTPAIAIEQSKKALRSMASEASTSLIKAVSMLDKWDDASAEEIAISEKKVDKYEDTLSTYLLKVSAQDLSVKDSTELTKILHIVGDFERISDHSLAISRIGEEMNTKNIKFSTQANEEIKVLKDAVMEVLSLTMEAFVKENADSAYQVQPMERVIHEIAREIKNLHIERLKNNSCTIELGFVLSDLLNNCKRVADHCSNIAIALIEAETESFAPHDYVKTLKRDNAESYYALLDNMRAQYKI
ncbi:MAG: Na/Pi cotransporter family protein [Oscillospiraceae bacterium]|nr:Na/Pi cotransporter family protein [Oscillospiraceae bacterium]